VTSVDGGPSRAAAGRPRVTTGSARDPRYPLFNDYLHHYEAVAELFDYCPFDPASYRERARELADWDQDRKALAERLEDYNRRLGAPPEALASARRLGEDGCLAVVGGQQPGVVTGPLYTFWKATAVVQLAEAVASRLAPGTPVVPVFWVGAEDHDLDEVAQVFLPTPEGAPARLVYDPTDGGRPRPPARTSVGYLPTGKAAQAFLDRFEKAVWKTEFTPDVMAYLRSSAEVSANLEEWFGRLLTGLLGDRGLVVASPLEPGLRSLQAGILRRMVAENAAVSRLLAEGQSRVRALGYEPQVEKDPASANLYLYQGPERVPLYRVEEAGTAEGSRGRTCLFQAGAKGDGSPVFTRAELEELAARTPERLSPNVVLRPLTQDAVFPVLAYVGGPGEISYFALYRDIYRHFGRRLPIVYPRPNVSLIEPTVARYMSRYGLGPEQALDPAAVRQAKAAYLNEADPVGIDRVFDRLEDAVRQAYGEVQAAVTAVSPQLETLAAKNLARVTIEMQWLRKKTWQEHRQRCRDAVRRLDVVEASLRPRGDYQERVYNIFGYLAKYGLGLARALAAAPLVPADAGVDPSHRFIWL